MLKEMLPHGAVLNPYVSYAVIQVNSGDSKMASAAVSLSEAQLNCLPDPLPILTYSSTRGPE